MRKWIVAAIALLFVGVAWQVYENMPGWRASANAYDFLSSSVSPDGKYAVDIFKSHPDSKDFTRIALRPSGEAIDSADSKRRIAKGDHIENIRAEWKSPRHLVIHIGEGKKLKLLKKSVDGITVELAE